MRAPVLSFTPARLLVALALGGCAFWHAGHAGWGPAAVPAEVVDALRLAPVGTRGTVLRLMGGPAHDVYLGCLSCPPTAEDAILNPDGPHGRLDGERSIWNPRSPYGGKAGAFSPWNPAPSRPPLVVTEYGHRYGVLTLAPDWPGRTLEPGLRRFVAVMGVYAPGP